MMNLTPFLLFDGNCAEAMTFYQTCLDGDLELTRVSDTPMKAQVPPAIHHRIISAHLKSGAVEFSATDWLHQTRKPHRGNTVALYLTGGSYADLRRIFDRLSDGAPKELLDDLTDLPFGTYGHLADKYGVHWFFRGEHRNGV